MCNVVLLPLARGRLLWIRPDSRYSSLLFVTFVLAISGSVLAGSWWYLRTRRDGWWQKGTSAVAFTNQPPTLRMASVLKLILITIRLCRTLCRSHALAMHNTFTITFSPTCHWK